MTPHQKAVRLKHGEARHKGKILPRDALAMMGVNSWHQDVLPATSAIDWRGHNKTKFGAIPAASSKVSSQEQALTLSLPQTNTPTLKPMNVLSPGTFVQLYRCQRRHCSSLTTVHEKNQRNETSNRPQTSSATVYTVRRQQNCKSRGCPPLRSTSMHLHTTTHYTQ